MTTASKPVTSRSTLSPSPGAGRVRQALRIVLAAAGWGLLVPMAFLAAYFAGWLLLAAVLLGSGPAEDVPALPIVLVPLGLTAGLAWLMARSVAPARRVARVLGVELTLLAVAGAAWAAAFPDDALFLARQVAWGDSKVTDYRLIPERAVANAGPVYRFAQNPSPESFGTIEYRSEGEPVQAGFEEFLQSTGTTSLIVIKDDAIRYEGYFNGYARDSVVTSFSVAKSFTSALVGIALDEGYIHSVDDPITDYLPELAGRGLDGVTVRHLLLMASGIRYLADDETPPLREITQFTDDGLTYAYPDLRRLALSVVPDGTPPGTVFNYNNYHPLLLGMILERTTGRPVAQYLEEKVWRPLGMEYPASWSLDGEAGGFELMVAGINARAIDFAKFGRLFLNRGNWNGSPIIPDAWVTESTSPEPGVERAWHSYADWQAAGGYYKYMWWGRRAADGGHDFMAQGKRGQWIYVSPASRVVIVRFGVEAGPVDSWPEVFEAIAARVK